MAISSVIGYVKRNAALSSKAYVLYRIYEEKKMFLQVLKHDALKSCHIPESHRHVYFIGSAKVDFILLVAGSVTDKLPEFLF